VKQALKKQIITVFEPVYLDIINDGMVGFATITAREVLDHLFMTYGNITALDLENNCNLLSPFKNRFKIVPIILKQEALSLGTHSRSMWVMPNFSQLGTS
jgi:hypothetical protein